MGLVLAFQSQPRQPSRSSAAARRRSEPSNGADILFFTGVRYERRTEAGSASAASRAPTLDMGQPAS
ncbi:hypothetical protein JOD31_000828 [Methylopila capsulata]|uniref:Uncharacterized protein n=1 Tax=Methylopila capsulata TaxID=61654 RepID=A0A9W6IUN4_9HYPH|nr:hypothetical protein [Methylopila capsulata]MBM7850616.1 hypothetical protein [Methylopila capsulata]GLK55909.1 hypothetical protein GCM10008170_19280 [Methylopila capsulata]